MCRFHNLFEFVVRFRQADRLACEFDRIGARIAGLTCVLFRGFQEPRRSRILTPPEEIARGKRPVVEPDDDFVEDSTMQDAPFPETPGDDETEDSVTEIEMHRFRTLLDMRFAGT
ncbi:unnamed protein product [Microthlaspi erraticum]|uniref:Uncharacterized protein n=1 Tax=Microthlaspi erraticum TaxID=1685480 RepID=A0A6D2HTP3_9BRAS|nr:unnamed protein product [Microthlaspi erraticum]